MKFLAILIALALGAPSFAGDRSGHRNYSDAVVSNNAQKFFVTNDPQIKEAFLNLWSESPEIASEMKDLYRLPIMTPVIIYRTDTKTNQLPTFLLDDDGKGATVYLSFETLARERKSLRLTVAAFIKTYHEAFFTHEGDSIAYCEKTIPTMLHTRGALSFSPSAMAFVSQMQAKSGHFSFTNLAPGS